MAAKVWTEIYRPRSLDKVLGQEFVLSTLHALTEAKAILHLLFYGPPGIGKTTVSEILRQHFVDSLALNASDDRGLAAIKKIEDFISQSSSKHRSEDQSALKFIILDETDQMTIQAQSAMRFMMEKPKTIQSARFCLICNFPEKIIPPIVSRCTVFRFAPLPHALMLRELSTICETERLICADGMLERVLEVCRGDMRATINLLQSVHLAHQDTTLTSDFVNTRVGLLTDTQLHDFIQYLLTKCTLSTKDVTWIDDFLMTDCLPLTILVNEIFRFLWDDRTGPLLLTDPMDRYSLIAQLDDLSYSLLYTESRFISIAALVRLFLPFQYTKK